MQIHARSALSSLLILTSLGVTISPVLAETNQLVLTIDSATLPSFNALIKSGESLTQSAIERTFAANPKTTNISVQVSSTRYGQEAPLMFVNVSRSQWRQQPNVRIWARYFGTSTVLLGFKQYSSMGTSISQKPVVSASEFSASHLEPNFYR